MSGWTDNSGMEVVGPVISYFWTALSTTFLQILVVLGPGLAIGVALHFLAGFVERRAYQGMGRVLYLCLFGWLGTAVHELGHALFCVIFFHRITEMRLFDPDPQTGTLGYVKHSFNPRNPYQVAGNFFIGIGPILLGTLVIYLLSRLLLGLDLLDTAAGARITGTDFLSWPDFANMVSLIWESSIAVLSRLFSWQSLSSWQTYLFMYFVFSVGSSITLSPSDLKGGLRGFAILVGLWFAFNLATIWIGQFGTSMATFISGFCGSFYAIMFLALLMNTAVAGLILLPIFIIGRVFGKRT